MIPTGDPSIEIPVECGIEEACWESVFNGQRFASLSAGRRCTLHESDCYWTAASGELTFSLEEFEPTGEVLDATIFGAGPGKNNPLVVLVRDDVRYLVPSLTLLSAVAFPSPNTLRALLTPGEFGYTMVKSGSHHIDIHCKGPWPPPGRTEPWLLRMRVHECLAFWLEKAERKRALQRCFYDIYERRPLRIPKADGRIKLRWEVYQEGPLRFIERLGAHQASDIWPHDYRFSDLIGIRGECLSSVGIPARRDRSVLPWP
ncbi:hypothetical protein [Roseateles chitinivorans]|uniref:hypothetical protein n=1 Tax=Roseateles chitinivorans TaxID=2917965 RepID=UPI003D676830